VSGGYEVLLQVADVLELLVLGGVRVRVHVVELFDGELQEVLAGHGEVRIDLAVQFFEPLETFVDVLGEPGLLYCTRSPAGGRI
jgi:hypothetical protein